MTWQPAMNTTVKHNVKSSVYAEYNNLLQELEQYMPQFKASMKDLQEPSQSFVTDFYTDVLSEFFCDVNNLTEIQVHQSLSYPEMYGEIVPILNMCTALRYIYTKLGVDDFGLNDICDPSPKRTYRLLQIMINFIKYSDEKINKADAKMKAVRNMKDTIDKLKKEKDIIVNTINQKSLNRKERESEIKKVADDVQSGKSELSNIHKHRDEVLRELNNVKQEQAEIEKKCAKLNELKENVMRDINALRSQIVEEPDLLKADYEKLKRLKNQVTEKKSSMMDQIGLKKQTVLLLEQELAAQEKRLRLLTDITDKNDRLLKLSHALDAMLQQKNEFVETSENLKERIEFVERERADINNKINYFVKEMDRERSIFKSKYDALQKEIDDKIKQKNHQCETVKLLENEINKLYKRKDEFENEVATIMEEFEIAKNTLNQLQKRYNDEVLNKLINDAQIIEFNPKKPSDE